MRKLMPVKEVQLLRTGTQVFQMMDMGLHANYQVWDTINHIETILIYITWPYTSLNVMEFLHNLKSWLTPCQNATVFFLLQRLSTRHTGDISFDKSKNVSTKDNITIGVESGTADNTFDEIVLFDKLCNHYYNDSSEAIYSTETLSRIPGIAHVIHRALTENEWDISIQTSSVRTVDTALCFSLR